MKLQNVSGQRLIVPGTQAGFVFAFEPFQVKEVQDSDVGYLLSNSNLRKVEFVAPPVQNIEVAVNPESTSTAVATGATEDVKPIVDFSPNVEQEIFNKEEPVSQDRVVKCTFCGKELKSKNSNFDDRVIAMHVGRFHKKPEVDVTQFVQRDINNNQEF